LGTNTYVTGGVNPYTTYQRSYVPYVNQYTTGIGTTGLGTTGILGLGLQTSS